VQNDRRTAWQTVARCVLVWPAIVVAPHVFEGARLLSVNPKQV
jgi:hypothetical protein